LLFYVETDEARLLNAIPSRFKKNASALLEEINSRGNELTWNTNGTIFVKQTSIPTSNIFEIFPLLYKVKKPIKIVPGLLECISQINDMGLSNLIVQKETKSSQKPDSKNSSSDGSSSHWWYIGP
jgi:hypothetical protein